MPRLPKPRRDRLFIPKRINYRTRCKGTSKGRGAQCKKFALPGYTVCRWHGAGDPLHGRPGGYKDVTKIDKMLMRPVTRRAQYLPDTLADRLSEAYRDPELLAYRSDIALIETRLSQLFEKMEAASPEVLKQVRALALDISAALTAVDITAAKQAAQEICNVVDKADSERQVWKEITELLEARRKLGDSEVKRLVQMNQMISAEDAMALIQRLLEAVQRHVNDPNVYSAIAYEFAIATGSADTAEDAGGSEEVRP